MAAYNPTWLEEPLPPDDHAAYRALRLNAKVPIATGEHEPNEAALIAEMIDILRRKMERDYQKGGTRRDAHPKTVGLERRQVAAGEVGGA